MHQTTGEMNLTDGRQGDTGERRKERQFRLGGGGKNLKEKKS
jgi:hypothetical protein